MKQEIVGCFAPVRLRRLLVGFFRPSSASSPPLHEAILVDQNDESSTKNIRDCDRDLLIQHLLNRSYRYKRKVDGSTVFEYDSSFPKTAPPPSAPKRSKWVHWERRAAMGARLIGTTLGVLYSDCKIKIG